jgi:hypothetical protein
MIKITNKKTIEIMVIKMRDDNWIEETRGETKGEVRE